MFVKPSFVQLASPLKMALMGVLALWLLVSGVWFMQSPAALPHLPKQAASALAENNVYTLPLAFVANRGQTERTVQFQTHSRTGTLFFTPQEVVIALSEQSANMDTEIVVSPVVSAKSQAETNIVRLRFIGANTNPQIIGNQQQSGVVNYLIGNNPAEWQTDLPTYAEIIYRDLYPGINLHYDGTEGLLKGTYRVAPGIDPSHIRWTYRGVKDINIDSSTGNLIITMNEAGDTLIEKAPLAWQLIGGQHLPVEANYRVTTDGTVSLTLGSYNADYPLVIDPTVEYSTYLGGNGNDFGGNLEIDKDGNMYIAGRTQSTNFPEAGDKTTDDENGFVVKLKADGSGLEFSTYFGGTGDDFLYGFALDSQGYMYISGETDSTDLPGSGGDNKLAGKNDGFVARLKPDGKDVEFGRYLGGTETDTASGLAVDSNDKVYVVGRTVSTDFLTINPLQAENAGEYDFFVARLNTDGTLEYSSYLGGSGNENRRDGGIALNKADEIYILGATSSTDFPTTSGAFQENNAGGVDLFVTKLKATGNEIIFSTYIGGTKNDQTAAFGAHSLVLDKADNIYITGLSLSDDYPVTPGVAQPKYVGQNFDGIVTKVAPDGSKLLFSTYLGGGNSGGNGNDFMSGIAVDPAGNVYVTGHVHSLDFPLKNAVQANRVGGSGASDANITKLKPDGSLDYSTFFGGSMNEWGHDIEVDENGTAYTLLYSLSQDVPLITNDAFQPQNGGRIDIVIAKVSSVLHVNQVGTPLVAQANSPVTYTVTVENSNPQTATNVVLTHTLPPGMTFEKVTSGSSQRDITAQSTCNENGDKLICDIGNLTAGQQETIEIIAKSPATVGPPLTGKTEVTAQHPNLGALTYNATETTFFDAADMAVKVVAPSPDENLSGDVGTNSVLTYPVTITNTGPHVATDVVLTTTLAEGMTFVGTDPTSPTCQESEGTIVCNFDTLAVNQSQLITLSARAPNKRGSFQNSITVTSKIPDQDITNNVQSASNFAEAYTPTVGISSTVTSSDSSAFTYTLQLTNTSTWFATFDVTATGNRWPTVVTPTEIVALEHLSRRPNVTPTALITVTVNAPSARAINYDDTVTIKISPRAAPEDAVSIKLTSRTTISETKRYLPIIVTP